MFATIAELARIRFFEPRRAAPGTRAAMHSNDNLPGVRRSADGQRPRPNLALACHWYLIGGRLACRWETEVSDGALVKSSKSRQKADGIFDLPPRRPRRRLNLRAAG